MKNAPAKAGTFFMAEREGFEPSIPFGQSELGALALKTLREP